MNSLSTELNQAHQMKKYAYLEEILAQADGISLSEMASVSLLDRIDTKYVFGTSQLCSILPQIIGQYRVLDIQQKRISRYRTLYFDTHDFTIYHDHHNGAGSRYKVRARKYLDSNLSFFEVKFKNNRRRTIKSRLPIPDVIPGIDEHVNDFVDSHTPFEANALEPKLWNDYLRITLVSKPHEERLTLDLNVDFGWGENHYSLLGIVIAEVKQPAFSQDSDFIQYMRRLGIRPISFSKYTGGVYHLYDHIKTNNFKPQMRRMDKVMQQELGTLATGA
jgi:hypothetical protein